MLSNAQRHRRAKLPVFSRLAGNWYQRRVRSRLPPPVESRTNFQYLGCLILAIRRAFDRDSLTFEAHAAFARAMQEIG